MSKNQPLLLAVCLTIGLAGGIYIERRLTGTKDPQWQTRPGKMRSIPSITSSNVNEELALLFKETDDPSEKVSARPFYASCSEIAGKMSPDAFPIAAQAALAQNESRRQQMLTQFTRRWVRVDLEGAKNFALTRTGPQRKPVLTEFMNAWQSHEPKSLADWLETNPDPDAVQIGVPILIRGLSEKNPERAFHFWKMIPPEEQFRAGAMLFGSWQRTAPAAMVTNLVELPELHLLQLSHLKSALGNWIKIDAPAAMAFLRQLPESQRRRDLIAAAAPDLGRARPDIAVQLIQSLPYSEYRQNLLRTVVGAWSAEDAHSAFKWAREQTDGVERRLALEASLDNLGSVDPSALQSFILQEPSHPAVVEHAAVLARHFAGTNASGLLDWARRLPPGRTRDTILGQGLAGLDALPPKEAVAFAIEHLDSFARRAALNKIFERWTRRDPQAASAAAIEIPLGYSRESVLEVVATSWPNAESEAASVWILSIQESPDRQKAEAAFTRSLEQRRPSEAARFVAKLKPSEHSAKLMDSAIEQWSKTDQNAAAQWLNEQPDDIRRQHGFGRLAEAFMTTDIKRAAEYALKSPNQNDYRDSRQRVANHWARTDPEAATKWLTANATNDVHLRRQFRQVFGAWARVSPEQAIQFLLALPIDSPVFESTNSRLDAVHLAVAYWAEQEPAAALKWSESHTTGSILSNLIQAILYQWANRHPENLLQTLRELPPGSRRDGLAGSALRILTSKHPVLAAHNVALVGELKERHSVMESIFGIWNLRDPDSARAWLRTNSLPEAIKTKHLNPRN